MDISSHSFNLSAEELDSVLFEENLMDTNNSNDLIQAVYFNETGHSSNATILAAAWRATYKPIMNLLLILTVIAVMVSMGCEVTWKSIFQQVKSPVGLCIGIFSQFVLLPLSAFCILLLSGIKGLHATGVLLISCCPGGIMSNTLTYFCEGNLALSVTMTCFSTVIAMGMMPFNIWLYGREFESSDLVMPYQKMAMSLIIITSPILVGMLIKWKLPRVAAITTKIGGYCSLLGIFVCISMEVALFPNMFTTISITLYSIILSLPIIGLILGYGLATLMKREAAVKKAIAIECGVQNVPLALTIIALSFSLEMQEDIVFVPLMYGISMMTVCTIICLTYHFCKKYFKKSGDTPVKEDILLGDKEGFENTNGTKTKAKPLIVTNENHTSKVIDHTSKGYCV